MKSTNGEDNTFGFKEFGRKSLNGVKKGLEKFSNNTLVKSLVTGFVSAMPIIMISSVFILITALPEMFEIVLPIHFKRFAIRIYQFTFGMLGMVITGFIGRALTEELNLRLPFDKKISIESTMVCTMLSYLIMSIVPLWESTEDSWIGVINITEFGAGGILPGIFIGLFTPYIFYWCHKYNITIRLPKSVPQVISKSFLSITPWFFSVTLWGVIGYGFILLLGEPFVPWMFEQLSNSLLREDVASSYGIIIAYRFLETFSWFIGVHPEAIQGVFENIMTINMDANLMGANNAFVESLMGPAGNMGGTGSTFVVPILMIMFAKSDSLKVAGKTSAIPVTFQVNEPILFGAPIILNPIFLIPFMVGPMITSCLAKVFVDNFGLQAATVNVPWSTPWFIRGPLAQLGQWQIFLLLLICFLILFLFWLPFVLIQDKINLKNEADGFLTKINGLEWFCQRVFNVSIQMKRSMAIYQKELNLQIKENKITQQELEKLLNERKYKLTEMLIKNEIKYVNTKKTTKVDRIESDFKDYLVTSKIDEKIINGKLKKDIEYWFKKKILLTELKAELQTMKYENRSAKLETKHDIEKYKTEQLTKIDEKIQTLKESNLKKILNKENPYVTLENIQELDNPILNIENDILNVLVLCIGAGTSAMLANSINNGAKEKNVKINAKALSYDNYKNALKDVDFIITSPQLASYFDTIEADAKQHNIKIVSTRGKQYIDLCNDKTKAVEFVLEKNERN